MWVSRAPGGRAAPATIRDVYIQRRMIRSDEDDRTRSSYSSPYHLSNALVLADYRFLSLTVRATRESDVRGAFGYRLRCCMGSFPLIEK